MSLSYLSYLFSSVGTELLVACSVLFQLISLQSFQKQQFLQVIRSFISIQSFPRRNDFFTPHLINKVIHKVPYYYYKIR